jgi:hypothetical protein
MCPFTPTKVSLLDRGRPSPTLIKLGVEGAQPPPRGHGGCAPKNIKRGNESPTLATPPRVGAKTLANPEPTGVGKRGSRGLAPWQGVWGMCPQNKKEGASCQLLHARHEWDPKRRQTLSQRGWGKGVQGAAGPLAGGVGGVPPQNQKKGASRLH